MIVLIYKKITISNISKLLLSSRDGSNPFSSNFYQYLQSSYFVVLLYIIKNYSIFEIPLYTINITSLSLRN